MIQYYLFDTDKKYLNTNYYDDCPGDSTEIAPTMDTQYSVWNGVTWLDSRGEDYIPVPQSVSAIQFLSQMEIQGITEDAIISIINNLPSPSNIIAKNSFYRATVFERSNSLLTLVAVGFGLSESQMDELFINAGQL